MRRPLRIERLLFHLAGIPTYVVVAELAVNRVLHGNLPRPAYPDALRRAAPPRWWSEARLSLVYARDAHAARGHITETVGAIATAACQTAHGVLAAAGQWITNEKTLIDRAGLRDLDGILSGLDPSPDAVSTALDQATSELGEAMAAALIAD